MNGIFDPVEAVADAIMYEGYVLYPYRASALKNRFRWQFGVVAPRASDSGTAPGPWYAQTECLVEPGMSPRLIVKVRWLHLQRRQIEEPDDGGWRAVDRLVVGDEELITWDEAVARSVVSAPLDLDGLCAHEHLLPFSCDEAVEREFAYAAGGEPCARITRQRWPLSALLRITAERLGPVMKVRVRVENVTPGRPAGGDRDAGLSVCLLGCHTLLHVQDGRFLSLMDPPPVAAVAARSCANAHTWPVLAGDPARAEVVLSSPIVLYDFPAVAPESRHDWFDATEIDEMLALRLLTMTDRERREAAATDERAGVLVRDTAGWGSAALAGLHGGVRTFERLPPDRAEQESAAANRDPVRLAEGHKVRICPRKRSDTMDMFFAGRTATVVRILQDLEDRVYLAVVLDDDPASDLHSAKGRYLYFSPEEVEPIDQEGDADARG